MGPHAARVAPRSGRYSVRSRLQLLVVACVLPAFLLSIGLAWNGYRQQRARLTGDTIAMARAMMAAIDRELAGTQAALNALATSPHLLAGDLAAFQAQAREALLSMSAAAVMLSDRELRQRLNTLRPYGTALPDDGNAQRHEVLRTGRPTVTDLHQDPVQRKRVISVAVPVYIDGAVLYVLSATVWPDTLAEALAKQRLAPEVNGSIFDSGGTVVARARRGEKITGRKAGATILGRFQAAPEGSFEHLNPEETPVLVAYSRSQASNWTVAIGTPLETAAAGLRSALLWIIAGTSLLLKEADEVGCALTQAARMLGEAEHRANHDALTGLANRALFKVLLAQHLATAHRTGMPLAVIGLDLDGFKPVNDRLGHAAGDAVLRGVAERLQASIRQSDTAARLGGDEFALLLPHTDANGAQIVARKLIERISAPYDIDGRCVRISASVGVAGSSDTADTPEALTRRADEAMYRAKAAGKHRLALAA